MRSNDAACFVGEQPLIFPAYGKPMPYMVHIPSGEISAVLLLKEPTVPKSGPASFRETGLASIMEKTVDSTGEYNYVNASIRMLCKEMPEHEGLSKTAIEDSCVILDRFPFSLPYGFKLEDFLMFLKEHHARVFSDYMSLTDDCLQSVLNLLETRNIGSQPLPPPKLYTFGAMARKSTEISSFLYMPSSAYFKTVCIIHPSVFVDLRHSPTNSVQYENIQAGLNDLLTTVAGRPVVGSFCSDFQSQHPLLLRRLREFRIEFQRAGGRAGGSATVATHGSQLANGGRAGGRATVATHGSQLANGARAGGRATVATHGSQVANGPRATVATHGSQLANGGLTGRGTRRAKNTMTADQSLTLHGLCQAKHKDSQLGFCWGCRNKLPHGYFVKLRAFIRCTCGKSFSTRTNL